MNRPAEICFHPLQNPPAVSSPTQSKEIFLAISEDYIPWDENPEKRPWFQDDTIQHIRELEKRASKLCNRACTEANRKAFKALRASKKKQIRRMKRLAQKPCEHYHEAEGVEEFVKMLQQGLAEARRKKGKCVFGAGESCIT